MMGITIRANGARHDVTGPDGEVVQLSTKNPSDDRRAQRIVRDIIRNNFKKD